jgi:hypothetical protein
MPKITQLPTIDTIDISLDDLLAIVNVDANRTDKISLEQLRDFILSFVATQINISQTVFVDANFGDDGTGLPYRFDKPFASIEAAVLAATTGDVVYIRPGVYKVFSNILTDGVNFYAEEGVNIQSFATLFNGDTTIGGTTLTGPVNFYGYAKILYCSGNLINIKSNPAAIVNLEFDSVQVNNISNGILAQDGTINLLIRGDYTCQGRNFSTRLTGNLNATIGGAVTCTFINVSNGCFWISSTKWSGKATIKAKSFVIPTNAVGGFSCHIYADNLSGSQLTIELDELIDTSVVAQPAIRINNAFPQISGAFLIKIKKTSTVRPLYENTNSVSKVILQIDEVLETGSSNHFAGELLIKNSLIKSILNIPILVTGGTVSLMATTIVSNGVNTTINNVGGVVLSEGSKGNVAPTNPVTGNFYINPLYTF